MFRSDGRDPAPAAGSTKGLEAELSLEFNEMGDAGKQAVQDAVKAMLPSDDDEEEEGEEASEGEEDRTRAAARSRTTRTMEHCERWILARTIAQTSFNLRPPICWPRFISPFFS